jgi:site-specific DNA-methyltransferase (adenine-specific)
MLPRTCLINGDCGKLLKYVDDDSIDLIITSPPYADQRKKTYGGIQPDNYVNWFLPVSRELKRILKPGGTFILNIKEKVVNGERHTYVMELIIAMRKQGWFWTEEFIWHKKNSYPGKWPNRFRDGWERLLQFNKEKTFKMNQQAVMVPVGDWADSRLKNLSSTDKKRDTSKAGSGFGKNISNWINRDKVYPDNVLYLATECYNRQHSAAFPESIPEWFINLFTDRGDWVLDPFLGSGTSCLVARKLKRNCLGFEINKEYFNIAQSRVLNIDSHFHSNDYNKTEIINSRKEEQLVIRL